MSHELDSDVVLTALHPLVEGGVIPPDPNPNPNPNPSPNPSPHPSPHPSPSPNANPNPNPNQVEGGVIPPEEW